LSILPKAFGGTLEATDSVETETYDHEWQFASVNDKQDSALKSRMFVQNQRFYLVFSIGSEAYLRSDLSNAILNSVEIFKSTPE
jgi:hypothetical protein